MAEQKLNGCFYDGRSYSEGAVICANGKELECKGGEWHFTGYDCHGKLAPKDDNKAAKTVLASDHSGSMVFTAVLRPAERLLDWNVGVFGTVGQSSTHWVDVGSRIVRILRIEVDPPIVGLVRPSGVGTNILTVTVSAEGSPGSVYTSTVTVFMVVT